MGKGNRKTYCVGNGMTKFVKCRTNKRDYFEMAKEACEMALGTLPYSEVKAAVCGYCFGEPGCGQRCLYELGLSGIPIFNTSNYCSTGSSAIFLARSLVESGSFDCVMALGVEKMAQGGMVQIYADAGYTNPVQPHFDQIPRVAPTPRPDDENLSHLNSFTANVIRMFGDAAVEHGERFGSTPEQMAKVAFKNHKHSVNNPRALLQREFSMEFIRNKMPLYGPLTIPQTAVVADGAAAVLICSEDFIQKHRLEGLAIEILGQVLVTDLPSSFKDSAMDLCGYQMCKTAADKLFQETSLIASDVDVVELHDCFSSNEMMVYEGLGLCRTGEGGKLADSGEWRKNSSGGELCHYPKPRGGTVVVNPSGGLMSKGHPIGATGVAQCYELCEQLRGNCGARQVPNARVALQHNFGLGSALVLTLYGKPSFAKL